MIVKNEYVKIKTDKEYTLKNYIYDSYLSKISKYQYDKSELNLKFKHCYLKFENQLEDIRNATYEDFDVYIPLNSSVTGNENTVECDYYSINNVINIHEDDYIGKKITAIGFGMQTGLEHTIYACVDTSNYSAYYYENTKIQRKDIFKTDAYVDGKDFPVNLSPISDITQTRESQQHYEVSETYTNLYSIGLGTRRGEMQEEYVIGEDIDINVIDDFSFSFKLRKGLEPNKYPTATTYTNNLYPLPTKVIKETYPSNETYASSSKFPMASDYKYIIYKYRYYETDGLGGYYDLDEYFTVSLPNDTKGLFEIVTKIERSDV